MSLSPLLAKIIGLLLAVLTPFLNFFMAGIPGTSSNDVSIALEKTGGYIKGVCHAEPQYELLNECNIEWFRDDIPFPYNKDGSLSQSYISWKEESKAYADYREHRTVF